MTLFTHLRRTLSAFAARTVFEDPPSAPLVLLDHGNPTFLEVLDLERVRAVTLTSEKLFIGPRVLAHMLFRIWRLRGMSGRDLLIAYRVACLRCICPRLVVTFLHNSPLIYLIARDYRHASFVALQNGREPAIDSSFGVDRIETAVTYYCFGDADVALRAASPLKAAAVIPVGSVLGAHYKACRAPAHPAIRYDLCLVSQFRAFVTADGTVGDDPHPQSQTLRVLAGYLKQLRGRHDLRIAIAGATVDDPRERAFFEQACGPGVEFSFRRSLSTYERMDQSRLVVGVCSTSLYEAFSWGKKTLFCDLTEPAGAPYEPLDGVWALRGHGVDFAQFEERVLALLAMDETEFVEQSRALARRFVAFDAERPACEVVRTHLHSVLKTAHLVTGTPVFQPSLTTR